MTELSVIGLNHDTAPVAVRGEVALGPDLVRRILRSLHAEDAFEEALVLDTCNRTEVYFVARRADDPVAYFLGHVERLKGKPVAAASPLFYRYDGLEAAEHLFRVAASLDSQVIGEHQILGQVKAAYRLAVEAHTARFLLNRLLHWAFRVGKRVQTETDLGRGAASVAQAAVERARRELGTFEGRTVLVVGAGKNARSAARILLASGAGRLVIANRTVERARQVACDLARPPTACGLAAVTFSRDPACPPKPEGRRREGSACAAPPLQIVGLDALPRLIAEVDLVVASTGSPDAVLDYDALAEPIRRAARDLVILDIAVPRDADPRLARLPGVRLITLDDLAHVVEENLERRRAEIPRAERIVAEETRAFGRWMSSLQVAPTIRLLQKRLDQVREDLLRQHGNRFSDADRDQLAQFTESLCKRILHDPLVFLRGLAQDAPLSDTLAAADLVRRLFDLDALEEGE
ncbi:MAG: glutamyl-tRNA reductase [Phycisphaerae bacterium]